MKLNLTLWAVASALIVSQLSCEAKGGGHGGGHAVPAMKSTPPPPPAKPTGSAGNYHGRRGLGRGRHIGGTGDLDQTNLTDDAKPSTPPHNVDPTLPPGAFVKTYSWGHK